jgi:hypothetical protein
MMYEELLKASDYSGATDTLTLGLAAWGLGTGDVTKV